MTIILEILSEKPPSIHAKAEIYERVVQGLRGKDLKFVPEKSLQFLEKRARELRTKEIQERRMTD